MTKQSAMSAAIPLGVVLRRTPGVTRWAKWAWKATDVLPGAASADWVELRRQGDAVEYHAATRQLVLWRSDTEAYLATLQGRIPGVAVVMRRTADLARPFDILTVTASAYEAQDYMDNGDDVVELVPMPPGLIAWIADFCTRHHRQEPFVKRKRGPRVDRPDGDGLGDIRVRQLSDVYRAPRPGGPT